MSFLLQKRSSKIERFFICDKRCRGEWKNPGKAVPAVLSGPADGRKSFRTMKEYGQPA